MSAWKVEPTNARQKREIESLARPDLSCYGASCPQPLLYNDIAADAAIKNVDSRSADKHVVASIAVEDIGARTADEHVVAVAAIFGQNNRARGQPGSLRYVVAAQEIDDELVVGT